MEAIFCNENVYVVIKNKDVRENIRLKDAEGLILAAGIKDFASLYGGRVELKTCGSQECELRINGISINDFCINTFMKNNYVYTNIYTPNLSFDQVALFLNQIENLGIDSFLDNYKVQLRNLKKELEEVAVGWQKELLVEYDENKSYDLAELRRTLLYMSCFLFSLFINMNAGLSNQNYMNAYDTIINMYF